MSHLTSSLRIIVTGFIAGHPIGGMAWHYLQYVVGLTRLGHEVYYFEDTGRAPSNPAKRWSASDCAFNVDYLAKVMSHFGLSDRWAYCFYSGPEWFGLSGAKRRAVIKSADLLINVSGSLGQPQNYRQVPRLVFVDTDPVFNQLKLVQGNQSFRAQVDTHDAHFSFGERFSNAVPATGHRWRPTRQPILLSEWRPAAPRRQVFTTVMNWMVKRPLVHAGQMFGQKDVEFKHFLELPGRVAPTRMELALTLGKEKRDPRRQLAVKGWHVVDPHRACPDYASYRRYIESSLAEWSVAKNGYVQGQSGWFSERSACYLAAGRPVIAQDTGFTGIFPIGKGLLSFTDMEEAVAAIREVVSNYPLHARAARAIAEEYFDSDKILTRLIEETLGDQRHRL